MYSDWHERIQIYAVCRLGFEMAPEKFSDVFHRSHAWRNVSLTSSIKAEHILQIKETLKLK